ncbi:hypothetical protein H0A36_26520 [Endozoicomonas sp. SM1973]|uniref:Uncharacterized protein n=1 Tax=Spartinivicinus marinus TaxID=2994442 RepID=A0A853IHR6_9GAMM|nr:hypothetical protein [Spartinivicinus marinus]MCX4030222.1 hypothetical protein [Spartinivicinus marinus]NYZ69574.1 hypothetical protein [Spartinivicinus marinus]
MNIDEQCCLNYLNKIGIKEYIYEPCGNKKFPDFIVNNDTIVEATRLTRVLENGKKVNNIPVQDKLEKITAEIGNKQLGYSWFIFLTFSNSCTRSIGKLGKKIRKELDDFASKKDNSEYYLIDVSKDLQIELYLSSEVFDKTFIVGGMDNIEGDTGWSGEVCSNSLQYSINDKTEKLEKFINDKKIDHTNKNYWLVLIDFIHALQYDRINEISVEKKYWNKIIVLNPADISNSYQW